MKHRQNKGKSNPVKRPATMRDVNRAKNEAFLQAVDFSLAIVFSVLLDKEGFNLFQIQRVWKEVQELSDSITRGYVKVSDLIKVLDEEYDIKFTR